MDSIASIILEPLSYGFMQRALIMSILIATICSIFSCFLVLKGWSLMGDAVSHAVLPGIAIAYIIGIPLAIGAFIAGLFCAIATGYIKQNSRVKEDAIMGIIFSGMFAVGIVILTSIETEIHLLHILFGNILGISPNEVINTAIVTLICTAAMIIKRKDFMLYCFDPTHASALGMPVKHLHFGLLILLAITIVTALKAAGIILVIAMLIAPGAIGLTLSQSFDKMLAIALIASIFSCISGTIISFHIDASTAPLIILIQAMLFIVALVYKKITMRNHTGKNAHGLQNT